MYPATQTYWLEPTDRVQVGLRRYTRHDGAWTCEAGWHQAMTLTGTAPVVLNAEGLEVSPGIVTPHDDPRWPAACEKECGYQFTEDDQWQDWSHRLYRRTDTGEEMGLRDAPPGASWNAWWLPESYRGPDGLALVVKCPNGRDWNVDSQASNCTRPGQPHQCWVRHGDPRECRVTVDKNGETCAAGAGSILAGDYHGFLRDGVLTAG
jgi:hypothetical protein